LLFIYSTGSLAIVVAVTSIVHVVVGSYHVEAVRYLANGTLCKVLVFMRGYLQYCTTFGLEKLSVVMSQRGTFWFKRNRVHKGSSHSHIHLISKNTTLQTGTTGQLISKTVCVETGSGRKKRIARLSPPEAGISSTGAPSKKVTPFPTDNNNLWDNPNERSVQ